MERVRLSLSVDDGDRVFSPGDPVTGTVRVEVDEGVSCKGIRVSLGWRTEGWVNSKSGPKTRATLPGGEWKGGDRFTFPFSLVVGEGPATYFGTNFQVAWTLHADAALSWARDPEVAMDLKVAAPPGEGGGLATVKEAGGFETGCAVTLVLLALAGAGILLSGTLSGTRDIGWKVAAWIVAPLALLLSFRAVPAAIAYRRYGQVVLEIGPNPVPRGGELAVAFTCMPRKDFTPGPLRVVLTGKETAVRGSGKHRSTRSVEVGEARTVLQGPARLRQAEKAEFAGILEIGGEVAPTIEAGDGKVVWKLEVTAVVPWLPDPTWNLDVTVA